MQQSTKEAAQRNTILTNARSLLEAAKVLDDDRFRHIQYHLGALSLEEVGKAELLLARTFGQSAHRASDDDFTDHVRKLFWAIWTADLITEVPLPDQIVERQGLAARIHQRRLDYLYTDVTNVSQQRPEADEVGRLLFLAEARLGLAESVKARTPEARDVELLEWFRQAGLDPQERQQLYGPASMARLRISKDLMEWIAWLRAEDERQRRELEELAQKEIARSAAIVDAREIEGDPALESPKWRMRFRLYCHSHSLRQKPLDRWNQQVSFMTLQATGKSMYSANKKDEILCTLLMPSHTPAQGVWQHGLRLSRLLAATMSIATTGVFWWYVPRHPHRYYEELYDLGVKKACLIQPSGLDVEWGKLVLTDQHVHSALVLFGYLARSDQSRVLEPYLEGLALFSKSDWHLRLEPNIFHAFWNAFKAALGASGLIGAGTTAEEAAAAEVRRIGGIDEAGLARRLQAATHLDSRPPAGGSSPLPSISLTDCVAMKMYCDVFLRLSAADAFLSPRGNEVPSR